jgi:AcrR family transcriptional regulator
MRQRIVSVADGLFHERGYDAVTLDAIAEEYGLLDRFRAALKARSGDAVTCWRDLNAETVQMMETSEARHRARRLMAIPSVFAEYLRISSLMESSLASAIDEDTGGADPLRAQLFATLLMWATSTTYRRWVAGDEPYDVQRVQTIIDRVIATFDEPPGGHSRATRKPPHQTAAHRSRRRRPAAG